MFKDLRQGTPIYIIHKGENPICRIGSVISVTKPMPLYQNQFNQSFQQEMVVDIEVKIGDEKVIFTKLKADGVIADKGLENGTQIFLSWNKDAINTEIESLLRYSREIIDSISFHKSAISGYEKILLGLNPSFAKEKQQEEEILSLKNQIINMQKNTDNQFNELKQLLIDSKKETNSNNQQKAK